MTALIALVVATTVGVAAARLHPVITLVLWLASFIITKWILDKYRP